MTVFTSMLTGVCGVILGFIIIVFYYACFWSIFKKSGNDGWWCLIPIANLYKIYEISFGQGLLFLLLFIPGVNVIIAIICKIKLGLAFGKGAGFCVGLIFLPAVFIPILALDDSCYIGVRN